MELIIALDERKLLDRLPRYASGYFDHFSSPHFGEGDMRLLFQKLDTMQEEISNLRKLVQMYQTCDKPRFDLTRRAPFDPSNANAVKGNVQHIYSVNLTELTDTVEGRRDQIAEVLRGRSYGGVAALIKNSLRHVTTTIITTEHFCIIKVFDCFVAYIYHVLTHQTDL